MKTVLEVLWMGTSNKQVKPFSSILKLEFVTTVNEKSVFRAIYIYKVPLAVA